MLNTGFWTIYPDDTAKQHGVNYDNATPIKVWKRAIDPKDGTTEMIVFKIPGGKHWVGRGMPMASHPGQFLVTRVVSNPASDRFELEHLFEMPLR